MNRFTPSRLIFATTLAGLGLALSLGAQAQPMGGVGMASDGMMRHPHMGEGNAQHAHMTQRWEAHQQELKTKLKLSSNQEPAWNTFVEAMKASAKPSVAQLDRDALAKLTTPERMDKMAAFHEAHETEMQSQRKQRSDATKQFYAQLTSEQQKVFDAQTLPREPHSRGHMGRGPETKAN